MLRLALFLIGGALIAQPYNGTVVGSVMFPSGKFANAASAFSAGNYITIPSTAVQFTSSTSMSIDVWFRSSAGPGWQFVFGNSTSAAADTVTIWGAFGSNGPRCQIGSGTPGVTTQVNDGQDHHVHCDLSGTTVRTFINGVLSDTYTTTFTAPVGTPFRIGANPAGGDVVNGQIDEIAIFNVSRRTSGFTPPTAAYTGSESNLRALYHLDSNATDSTGASTPLTPGTLSGAVGLDFTAATGGTSPYSYQLQSYTGACASGTFSNDGAALTGQTSSALFARTGATVRCFRVLVTDAASATATSNSVTSPAAGGGMSVN